MSCAEVMYQPYSPYFPYHHQRTPQATEHYRKFVRPPHAEASCSSASSSLVDPSAPSPSPPQQQHKEGAEKGGGGEAHYLSANCVLLTYYSGDISAVVDEHFARALSQAYPTATPQEAASKAQAKDGPPMSHRNFPPSFWNSNYQPTPTPLPPDLPYAAPSDPYHHHPGSLHATLHHQPDPWAHPYSTGCFPHYNPHPGSAPRFAPNYPSLLLQPAVRSSRLGPASAACASLEKAEGWSAAASRYHHDSLMDANYGAAYGAMTPMTDPSSSGYMSMYEVIHNMQRSYR